MRIKKIGKKENLCFWVLMVSLFIFNMAAQEVWAKSVTRLAVGGNGIGGVYYLYSGALSQMINKYIPNVEATVEVCAGSSVEHIKRMQIGEIQIAPAMNDAVYNSLKGTGQFKGIHDKIRTLFIMYPAVLQAACLEKSGIKTFADLAGKRVSIGNPGTGTYMMTMAVLEALGIDPKSLKLTYLNWNEGGNAIRNGNLDIQFIAAGYPSPWIMDLAATHKISLLRCSDNELAKIHQKFAYYPPAVIPGGTYAGVKEDAKMPGIWNSYLASKDLPDELAYQITKIVYEHIDDLKKVYKDSGQATPENTIKYAIAPLHPGALKFYREKGYKVPENLLPK